MYTTAWLSDPVASVLPFRLWQILSGCWEADLQSAMRAIFTLAQVWLSVFSNTTAKEELKDHLA